MQKKYWVSVVLLVLLLGGIGLFFYSKNEQQRKEQEVLQMELTTAKQIKNTFADVTKIEFAEKYGKNKLTGYTETMATVSTCYGVDVEIGVSMSKRDKVNQSYVGSGETFLKKGITETKVRVIFFNKDEGSV